MSELKPCPFCGRKNPTCIDGWVYCKTCDNAIDESAWNTRPIEDSLQAEYTTLLAAIEFLLSCPAFACCSDCEEKIAKVLKGKE